LNTLDTISSSKKTLTDGDRTLFVPHTTASVFLNSSACYVLSSKSGVFSVRQGLDFYILLTTHRGFTGPCHESGPASIPAQSAWDMWRMKQHWDRVFSEYSGFLCQYRSANAPYTPWSTVALTRTNGRSLGTFKSNAVSVIRTRFWRLHWANTSAVGTTSWYLTSIYPNVDSSWLAF